MRKSFVVCAVLAFACLARADVDFGDIVRWGLMRKADVFPGGSAALTSPTSGVLRVIETRNIVDYTRLSMTVVSNMYTGWEPEMYSLTTGVYRSGIVEPINGGLQTTFAMNGQQWIFVWTAQTWGAAGGPMAQQYMLSPGEDTGFASTNAWNVFPTVLTAVHIFPPGPLPDGKAIIDYYRYTEVVTNDFVSAVMLQDTIDDLRQEISEALEAHVQLLH